LRRLVPLPSLSHILENPTYGRCVNAPHQLAAVKLGYLPRKIHIVENGLHQRNWRVSVVSVRGHEKLSVSYLLLNAFSKKEIYWRVKCVKFLFNYSFNFYSSKNFFSIIENNIFLSPYILFMIVVKKIYT